MTGDRRLRVAVLTASERGNAARVCHHLLRAVPEVEVVGAVVDLGSAHDRGRQLRRLRAWRRSGGALYAAWRLWLHVEPRVRRRPPPATYPHSLGELGERHGFEVVRVPSVNAPESVAALRRLAPDVALSVGNRFIRREVFALPPLGTLNLHHGHIPDFRGGPPAFWEIHDGAAAMGVSVHRVDDRIDHGEVLARGEVPVLAGDTPLTLMARARTIDFALVAEALRALAAGTARPLATDLAGSTVRTLPGPAALRRVRRRAGRRVRHDDHQRAPLDDPLASSSR